METRIPDIELDLFTVFSYGCIVGIIMVYYLSCDLIGHS